MSRPLASRDGDSEGLCTRCGLCCDGTLFDHVPIADDEREPLQSLGLVIGEFGGKTGFRQPCLQFRGDCCAIYGSHPRTCRQYRCITLKQLDEGEIDRDEAEQRIARAREHAEQLRDTLEPGTTIPGFRASLKEFGKTPPRDRAEARVQLLFAALNLRLDRYFRTEKQRLIGLADTVADA